MGIDERLEALAQTVELMAAMQRDNEKHFQEQAKQFQNQFSQHEQLFGQVALQLQETREFIDRLARIAGVHQERLDDHDQRLSDLEQGPRP